MNPSQNPVFTVKILSVAMMVSVLIFFGVAVFTSMQVVGGADMWSFHVPKGMQVIFMALGFVALVNAGLSAVIHKFLDKAMDKMTGQHSSNPANLPPVYSGENKSSWFYDWSQFKPHMQTSTIVRLALAESVAIFGLVLSFLSHVPMNMVPFLVLSLVLMYLWSPLGKTS
jgi:F0F1-type ATP synthase membrane subunit c/vacuolar-type H+-ATPase subunit K